MESKLVLYNTLKRDKEVFTPLHAPHVGLYVCGPTVYGDTHLGHARPYITFDLLRRYLTHLGYKVRYVRNITDVGHLENDADEGEDKIAKKARLEQLEPMEIAHYYAIGFQNCMEQLNVLRPNIEPLASGHIPEQIEMIEKIIANGFAYEVNGSVYFDVAKYSTSYNYGELSGRVLEDLVAGAGEERRKLEGQNEKHNPNDFALWKKAGDEHIMRWNSPWGVGFPGWHLECSAMSGKYLGGNFDIHGGGMDLLFPHHECEIAQSVAARGIEPVRYWMHCNMLTINGQKMGKSLGNFITLSELFSGSHALLEQAYSPMTIRFFMLQAHYRSTLDFSNTALKAAEKGLARLLNASHSLSSITPTDESSINLDEWTEKCYAALNDDMNSAILIAHLFDAVNLINQLVSGSEKISEKDFKILDEKFKLFVFDILALKEEKATGDSELINGLMQFIITQRLEARKNKDFATSDKIRDELMTLGIVLKDDKEGTKWMYQ